MATNRRYATIIETMSNIELQRALVFIECRDTAEGLKHDPTYLILTREAVSRGLRKENLTERQVLARIEDEGPDMNRFV
jgi:hypothetical protein